jgi:hypothetical protein
MVYSNNVTRTTEGSRQDAAKFGRRNVALEGPSRLRRTALTKWCEGVGGWVPWMGGAHNQKDGEIQR